MKKNKKGKKLSVQSQAKGIGKVRETPSVYADKGIQSVCFLECSTKELPNNKGDVKKVVETLIYLCDSERSKRLNIHPIDDAGIKESFGVGKKIKLLSADVGGRNTDRRLLYHRKGEIARIISLYTNETHK